MDYLIQLRLNTVLSRTSACVRAFFCVQNKRDISPVSQTSDIYVCLATHIEADKFTCDCDLPHVGSQDGGT